MSLHLPLTLAVALALGSTLGCASNAEEEESGSDGSEIKGGKADARTAPAVGALVSVFPGVNGELFQAFCTATLIAPKLVVTAKHCTLQARGKWGFATGAFGTSDITTGRGPDRFVQADHAEEETTITGGDGVGLGSDVALVHLKQAITDIEPLAIDGLVASDVGTSFGVVGYGVNKASVAGERRSAKVIVMARTGKVLPPLVSFAEYARRSGGTVAENRAAYDGMKLLEGYEAVTGHDASGAQLCNGDSGGPLLGTRGGQLKVVGVASYVLATPKEECVFGTVYATFGPAARRMLDRALR